MLKGGNDIYVRIYTRAMHETLAQRRRRGLGSFNLGGE